MDLSNEIRAKLFSEIHKDLEKQIEQQKDESVNKIKEILKVWLNGRISDDIKKLIETNPEQFKFVYNISLCRVNLKVDLKEFEYRGYYRGIKFEKEDKIPALSWIQEFSNAPHKYVDTPKEKLLYRELQNAFLLLDRYHEALKNFDDTYCIANYWSRAETFLQPQNINTSDQLREQFPEWYYKYFIPYLEKNPELNLNGWESLIKILKK